MSLKLRRTKIVATLGPAVNSYDLLERILDAGVDVVRINLSHGNYEEHSKRIQMVRDYCQKKLANIGVLLDLQGPKIRIGSFIEDSVLLKEGDIFTFDTNLDIKKGTKEAVGISYKDLLLDVSTGSTIILGDGHISIKVIDITKSKIIGKVIGGGYLSNNIGLNLLDGGISANNLTKKDIRDIEFAYLQKADFLALSFVSSAADIIRCREILLEHNFDTCLIAKIERANAVKEDNIEAIIAKADGIMVARGDLGIEIGDPRLPATQKKLIFLANKYKKFVITATQMLETMVTKPTPTRAEVFDIANAVLDGTDAVMLSGETAIGKYPLQTVQKMSDVCLEAEKSALYYSQIEDDKEFHTIDEAVALSTMYAANNLKVSAIIALTQSGKTALWMSRVVSETPIFAMSNKQNTRQKVTLYRGVYPCIINFNKDWDLVYKDAFEKLKKKGIINTGDLVILTKGTHKNKSGGTDMMRIFCVD